MVGALIGGKLMNNLPKIILYILLTGLSIYLIIQFKNWLKNNKSAEGKEKNDGFEGDKMLGNPPKKTETTIWDFDKKHLTTKGSGILNTLLKELFATSYTSDDKVKSAITQLKTVTDLKIMTYFFDNMSKWKYNGETLKTRLAGEMFDSGYSQVLNYINKLPKTI